VRAYSDGSQRARRLIAGLAAHGVPANRHDGAPFALLATDAANARRVLARIAARRHPSVRGIYLAPWLLDGAVLSTLTSLRLPPLLVPAPVDPMSPTADRYRAALAVAAGGIAPSVAGLLGWLSVVSPAAGSDDVLTLYAATPVGFLPGVLDVGHQHGTTGWFTGGTLVATSAPVPVPMSQGVH
jgi:hypothetical protein